MLASARELLAINAILARTLPAALGRQTHAVRKHGPTLEVMVPGSAYAARLRQLTRLIADALTQAGWPVDHIVVRISIRPDAREAKPAQRENRSFDATALAAFETLEQQVAPGPLADAIRRLLTRHR